MMPTVTSTQPTAPQLSRRVANFRVPHITITCVQRLRNL
jgi:hypothetical protein